ncbi:MAG: PAS domain-containing sensor histidine kinase [Burkholderiales bacterium]
MTKKQDNPIGNAIKPHLSPVLLQQLDEAGEASWIDVIRKMEEVYNNVLRYQVELEEKNAALEEAQQFILSILTAMSDVLIVCDRNGMVEEVNRAMLDLLGLAKEAVLGRTFLAFLADEDSKSQAQSFPLRLREQLIHDCEVSFKSADGGFVPVALNCTPRYDTRGRQAGMVLVGRPVGELRKAYHALNQAHEELKLTQQQLIHSEKMASLGRLVAGVAHELNNPISFVLGNVYALQRYRERILTYINAIHGGACAEECEELRKTLRIDRVLLDLGPLIEGTVEGAERTRDIVQDLRRFSAVDKEETKLFDLADVTRNAVHWATRDAKSALRVSLNLPPQPMPVLGTAGQMQQVVVNLVQNAADATLGLRQSTLSVSGRVKAGKCLLEFHDNGPGIDASHLSRVFDPFFTTKPVGKGVGLGLSISYGIVERHGGTLSAANHPGGGAVFTLTLPLAESNQADS